MGRLIALLLGIAALAFAAKYALTPRAGPAMHPEIETGIKPVDPNNAHTRPRQELDNVRDRSHELEKEMQNRADHNEGAADPH